MKSLSMSLGVLLCASISNTPCQAFYMTPIKNSAARPLSFSAQPAPSAPPAASAVTWDWESVAASVFEEDERSVILFDGVCNLCCGTVNFALDNDMEGEFVVYLTTELWEPHDGVTLGARPTQTLHTALYLHYYPSSSCFLSIGNFRFASLQSKIGKSLLLQAGRQSNDMSSIVLVKSDGNSFFESDAILRISQKLDGPLFQTMGVAGLAIPRMMRDALYHVVSENRYRFGEKDQCRLDWDGEFDDRFVDEPEGL